jgi:cytochrome c-type biogenesis protein
LQDLNVFIAFGAGVLSFVSPCVLPIYPGFLSYITGVSIDELKENNLLLNRRAMIHTLFFVLGFSLIFIVLGLSSSLIHSLFSQYNDLIRQISAILILFFGLVIVGFIKPKFLMQEKRISFKNRPSGYLGSVLIGIGFAAGWTPCIGPILTAVFNLGIAEGEGLLDMIAYTLGFSIPFFAMSFFIGKSNLVKKYSHKIYQFGGYAMIFMGIFLFFDWMSDLSSFISNYVFGGFTGF